MLLHWTPPTGDPRTFIFRPDDLRPAEYEPIEALGTWPSLAEFTLACQASQRTAWRVALWVCLRRDDPAVELDAVQPTPLELAMEYEPDENLALAELNLADPDCPPELRALLEASMPDLLAAAGKAPGPAASRTSAGRAGGTSRSTSGSGTTKSSRPAPSGRRSRGSTTTKG